MKEKLIKALFYILVFIGWTVPSFAYQSTDSSAHRIDYTERSYDQQKLKELRADETFQYEVYKERQKGAFQRFIERIQRWFFSLIGSGAALTLWGILWRLILVAAFILLIIKIFGIETSSIFQPAKAHKKAFKIDEESLDDINFDEELQKAFQSSQWSLAIRLIYLYSLKHLADTEMVLVKKGKTNQEYLYEINKPEVRENFSGLSFLFDYTWYGHFEASQSMADKAKKYLDQILATKA